MKIKDVMTRDVITLMTSDTIDKAVKIILDSKISGLPVMDENKRVVGVVSESDLIYREKDVEIPAFIPVLEGFIFLDSVKKYEDKLRKKFALKAKDIMNSPPITIYEDDDIHKGVNIMLSKKINRIPVVDEEEKLVGIVTRSDILKSFKELD